MRIAILADSFLHDPGAWVNGTQVQMYNLATAFRERGADVHYVSLTRDRSRLAELPRGISFHWIERTPAVLSWCRDLSDYRRLLDEIAPDAVYQRGRSQLTWVAARWARDTGRPFVWGSNGEDSCTFWKSLRRILRSPRPAWKKALLLPVAAAKDCFIHRGIRGASRVVTQTRHQAETLRANFAKDGLILPSTFPAPPADGVAKEKVVLWLANLSHAKRPELFLDLAERCRDLAGWTFVLGGGTRVKEYADAIARRAAGLPNVELLGPVPFAEASRHYARAALYVNTSRAEADGLPNAYIQAWLHGTPVLSLEHDPNGWIGERGLGLCARGDLGLFLDRGRALVEGGAGAMGPACARFARETFATERTIDAYLELFRGA